MTASGRARAPRIARVALSDFRSYAALDLSVGSSLVALTGENGAGKTNLIEAISLFTPGRGLRRADLSEMARSGGSGGFAVALTLHGDAFLDDELETRLGTGLERAAPGEPLARRYRIDGDNVGSASAFADHLRIVWLVPAMDGLFTGAAGERRRFLDRLVLAIDPKHGSRVSAYERALRARNRLLEEPNPDRAWLEGIEAEAAALGIAIARIRGETVRQIAAEIEAGRSGGSPFPHAVLALEGDVDRWLAEDEDMAEPRFRAALREGRPRDAAARRALTGPQASDLLVRHGPKDVAADRASTGEQKALLVGLVLAHARLVAKASDLAPIVLLDEIGAHLDTQRRAALYESLADLGSQVFMTGADPNLFAELPQSAEIFVVKGGGSSRAGPETMAHAALVAVQPEHR